MIGPIQSSVLLVLCLLEAPALAIQHNVNEVRINRPSVSPDPGSIRFPAKDEVASPPTTALRSPSSVAHRSLIGRSLMQLALDLGQCRYNSACTTNNILSSASIATTLTLLMLGTDGKTAEQLRQALHYTTDTAEVNKAYQAMINGIKQLDVMGTNDFNISMANAVFSREKLTDKFQIQAKDYFSSKAAAFKPTNSLISSYVTHINSWVANETNGKINEIINDLPPDWVMVVVNAVYFSANWAQPFNAENTRVANFSSGPDQVAPARLMYENLDVDYAEDADLGCKAVALPYKGNQVAMYILLPMEDEGISSLNKLRSKLNVDSFNRLLSNMTNTLVGVNMPRFRIVKQLSLKNILIKMGVTDLFAAGVADLSRMTLAQGHAVDDIAHKSFIDVTETGTEAAAATAAFVTRTTPAKIFRANKPFLFFIMNKNTRNILFSGQYVRPQ